MWEGFLLLALWTGATPPIAPELSAQTPSRDYAHILGRVVTDYTFEPVPGALVSLEGTQFETRTDKDGRFQFRAVGVGTHHLVIRAVGYSQFRYTLSVEEASASLDLEAVLTPSTPTLENVVARAPAGSRLNPFMADFESRRAAGFGRFLTEEKLAPQGGRSLDALLRNTIPGLRMFTVGSQVIAGSTRGLGTTSGLTPGRAGTSGRCYVQVIVDNVVVYNSALSLPLFDLRSLDVGFLAGVEYYTPSQTPAEFNRGGNAPCGTLVIWRKN